MANQVFVSPGVYTSEKDLTYITRQVGVTTLGLVGETTQGPAFQPIFVSNYGEFQSFFGGLDNTLVNGPDGNGAPLYELPYIAKSYLSQSNQLFVTRVLGLSGYDAGKSWAITLNGALDPSTTINTTLTYNGSPYIVTYSATTGGTIFAYTINDPLLAANSNLVLNNPYFTLPTTSSQSILINLPIVKNANGIFTGATFNLQTTNAGYADITILSGASDITNYNTLITYTGSSANPSTYVFSVNDPNLAVFNNSLVTPNIVSTLQASLNNANIGTTGTTNTILTYSNPYNFSGISSQFIVTNTGTTLVKSYFPSRSVTSTPLITYTAYTSLSNNSTIYSINEPLLNTLYNLGNFSLSNLSSLTTGQTGNIPLTFSGTGSVITGASAAYLVTSKVSNTPVTTTGTSATYTNNSFITYTLTNTGNLISASISEPLLSSFYNNNLFNLNTLTGLTTGNTYTIPITFSGDGITTNLTGASATYKLISSAFTQTITGGTAANNIYGGAPWNGVGPLYAFTATTGGTLVSYAFINNGLLTAATLVQQSLLNNSDVPIGPQSNNGWMPISTASYTAVTNTYFLNNGFSHSQTDAILGYVGNGNYVGGFLYNVVITNGSVNSIGGNLITGTTTGAFYLVDGYGTPQTITGTTSGITTEYSGTVLSYTTGATTGITSEYIGYNTILATGTTSGTTTIYNGTISEYITGTTTGTSTTIVGTSYSDVDNKVVALLRSRGTVDASTQLHTFQVTGGTNNVNFDQTVTGVTVNPLGIFSLSGNSTTQGLFDYSVSFDTTQKNFISRVLGRGAQDGKTALFLEEFYENMFDIYNSEGKILGINLELVEYNRNIYSNYLQQYQQAITPYVVSELRGNKVLRLFRLYTISDGNTANQQFKISIVNIKPDVREFDLYVRSFYDTDAAPQILESYSRLTMDPTSGNYIAKRIGTTDGNYTSMSSYILVEMDNASDTSDAFPAGFVGYPVRDYDLGSDNSVKSPSIQYKQSYLPTDNIRKVYLGLSDTVGIDVDFFDYKGLTNINTPWTGLTDGFHMDINASGVTVDDVKIPIDNSGNTYSPIFNFNTGDWVFTTDAGLVGGPYEKIYSRKFTFTPYGGFDGWDIYRTRRSNLDGYQKNGVQGKAGTTVGTFKNRPISNGDLGINSDYYAFLEGIYSFSNPEAVNINIFATPGIDTFDNTELVNSAIEMIETQRADSLYVVTTPDTDASGAPLLPSDVTDAISGYFDSSYTATYWPWIQILDAENNAYIYVPPTRDVVRNIALTDNIAFPWFAVAGVQRGDVDCIKARVKLTLTDRDTLYENRINPIATFVSDGVKIWGNKTLQVNDTALNRINVRRLLLQARKLISAVAIRLLFEQNDTIVRNQFLSLVNPILDNIRSERGLTDFRVVVSNSPEDIDNNQLTGQIFLKPTRALEFIQVQFVIMNTGASFDNI